MAVLALKPLVLSFIPFLDFVGDVHFGFPKMRSLRVLALFAFNDFWRWILGLSWYSVVWTSAQYWLRR